MKPKIKINGQSTTIWMHRAIKRATGLAVKNYHASPGLSGARFIPRSLGPAGIALVATGQQAGWELWTDTEKWRIWPSGDLDLKDITAFDAVAGRICTKAGLAIDAEIVLPEPLTLAEISVVQNERLIAAQAGHRERPSPERENQPGSTACRVCHWRHDANFTQVLIPGKKIITLSGILPDIVACIHGEHEKGLPWLSTKDDRLVRCCGGGGPISKAFYDRGQREAYRILFVKKRGFIALGGFHRKQP